MGLKDLQLPQEEVAYTGGSLSVRGLNIVDVSFLIRNYGDSMTQAFDQITGSDKEIGVDNVMELALPLIESFPSLVAQVIACAADEPEQSLMASRLPFPAQLDAVEKILALTFDASGGPKKFMETVLRLAQGTNGLLQNLKA